MRISGIDPFPAIPSIAFAVRDLLHLLSQKFWLNINAIKEHRTVSQPI